MTAKLLILAMVGMVPIGCVKTPVGFDSPAPSKRLDAIVAASTETDTDSLIGLVEALSSTEPAARMLAIRSLERRTGQTLGYEHAGPIWQRREAVNRWVDFVEQQRESPAAPPEPSTAQAGTQSP